MNFIENKSAQKLRGGYYTPSDLAAFLARWVKQISPKKVLEPSCGNGVFFDALRDVKGLTRASVTAFELDAGEAAKANDRARQAGLRDVTVTASDFLGWAISHLDDCATRFDAVIGNPPFVRYQYLPNPFQVRAEEIFQTATLALHQTHERLGPICPGIVGAFTSGWQACHGRPGRDHPRHARAIIALLPWPRVSALGHRRS